MVKNLLLISKVVGCSSVAKSAVASETLDFH